MTLLLDPARIPDRRAAARGALSPLAHSLTDDLQPLLERDLYLPLEKARLSRVGGRCPHDGALLEFDPFTPRRHDCGTCGRSYEDEAHYRSWIMSYQLWLAERAVHGALLGLLRDDARAAALSESILEAYVAHYLEYPNRDNVLGPSRLFFSTYLESIWLLQIIIATDLLEATGTHAVLAGHVRDRIVAPARALIQSYDEGGSNRQVWNNAALLAAAAMLGTTPDLEPLVWGPSGLTSHLARGLLGDGTWFEGENYHLFAHRGLWYGVQLAERLELGMSESFVAPYIARFEEGFAASFVTALPDLTLPSRRDSQYAISVRQWRFAELCELGLARREDPRLSGMLARLYGDEVSRSRTGRERSTAEVERNVPATLLRRSDLGWRSLLLARPILRPAGTEPPGSVLLEGQGYGILRRGQGSVYVALDYGHSGGGHGHPDRLNLQLAHDGVRWLDDMGTGSYVDPTLHWYRSTLAHNAPLVNGKSQARVHGRLLAFDDNGTAGWIDAEVQGIAPGVGTRRSVIATADYAVDVVEWEARADVQFDLPIHLDLPVVERDWIPAPLTGGSGLEDGFDHVSETAFASCQSNDVVRLSGTRGDRAMAAWISVASPCVLWRAAAPGAPGRPRATFLLIRCDGRSGVIRAVLDWSASVRNVRFESTAVIVERADGIEERHQRRGDAWRIEQAGGGPVSPRVVDLAGTHRQDVIPIADAARASSDGGARRTRRRPRLVVPVLADAGDATVAPAVELNMGEKHYRRSELGWTDAGAPTARVQMFATTDALILDVEVRKTEPVFFAPSRATNDMDNEPPDINSDGLQLYLAPVDAAGARWLLVPEQGSTRVRVTATDTHESLRAEWRPVPGGYAVRCQLTLTDDMRRGGFDLDLIVNEMPPDRERRRGQLVLSGAAGEWVYLRGDRHARESFVPFALDDRGV